MRWTPHATVATIVEQQGRFLLVEEFSGDRLVLNQPAGHLEQNETFYDAARRETLEETGWEVEPRYLLGLYVYRSPTNGVTYHRTCFIAEQLKHDPNRELDEGIVRVIWMTRDEVAANADRLRSELVLRCIDDYLAGKRYPISLIYEPRRKIPDPMSENSAANSVANPVANPAKKVIVGMSGGVDSSVSALLLKQQGYQVEGLFMKNWEEDDGTEYCTAKEDLADAQAVCDKLGIRLHTANFAAEYWDNVFEHFLAEYKAGRTPNPDILCNREIKFKAFLEYARMLGADLIATGHYVRRDTRDGHAVLLKGLDPNKDQSYFLHQVGEAELALTLFPVGELEKPVVRALAEEHGLITHDKKDSTGICFIGERRFSDFLKQYLPARPGKIETPDGDVIGDHQGLMYYTIGQRQGLGIGGLADYPEEPWFVAGKDLERNVLIAVQGTAHPLLFSDWLCCAEIFWINGDAPTLPLRCKAKVRYRQSDQSCVIEAFGDGFRILFDEPQRAVTPGQSVVFYLDDLCLGGGVIETTSRTHPEESA